MAASPSGTTVLADLRAAVSAALIGVPQEINYGLLAFAGLGLAQAGLGVLAALTASALAALCYAGLGAGRHQLLGPRPTLVVLVGTLLAVLSSMGVPQGQLLPAVMLTQLISGLLLLLAATAGLGRFFKYMPLPVLAGFTNGVAATLLVSALPIALGNGAGRGWMATHWAAVPVALLTLFLCLRPLRIGGLRRVPGVLQALLAATLLHHLLGRLAPQAVGPEIAELIRGLGNPGDLLGELAWPALSMGQLMVIGKFALAMAVAAALETLATTAYLEAESTSRSNGEAVLRRLAGVTVLLSPLMMPVAGSLGRSMALVAGGARTTQARLWYALLIVLLPTLGASLIALVPQAAIAGILLAVARNMVGESLGQGISHWRGTPLSTERNRNLADLMVMLGVALITVADSFITALGVGVVAAMALFIRDQSRAVVRRISRGDSCRSLRVRSVHARDIQARHGREIVVVEAEGLLFFGSMERLVGQLDALAPQAMMLVLDVRRVGDIDQTAGQLLRQAARRYREQGCRLMLSGLTPGGRLRQRLLAWGAARDLPEADWFVDLDSALEIAEGRLLARHGLATDGLQVVPLVESDLAGGLTLGQISVLAGYLRERRHIAGDVLFRQGEAGDSLLVIVRGAVSIRFAADIGGKRLIAFGPGALFGEMALVTGAPRSADAVVDEDSELLELSGEAFARLGEAHPEIAVTILRRISALLSDRLRNTTGQLREVLAE